MGRIAHYFYVKVASARFALGNLELPRTPGIWHALLRCLSRLRSTGKLVFLGDHSRISTTLRIWQSLVRLSPVEYRIMDFSGRKLPDMPYSALLGSTVDTCLRQSTSSCFLLVAMHLALCSLACRPSVADNSGSTRLVLLVTKHLALFSFFPSSGPDARHHCQYGREGQSAGASLSWCGGRFPWSSLFRRS